MKQIFYSSCFILSIFYSYSQPGNPDQTFNNNGKALTSFYYDQGNGPQITGSDFARAIAIQADGKIVIAGETFTGIAVDFGLARYNTNGSPDNSFGGSGTVNTNFSDNAVPKAIAIQADGRIIAAGTANNGPGNNDFAVTRYNTDGSLDASFGTGGIVYIDFGDDDRATSVAIQGDGKIIVAGSGGATFQSVDFALVRCNPDGTPDSSFDGDGKLIISFGSERDYCNAVAIQSDGKIVLAGIRISAGNPDFAVARCNTDGTPDNSFDGDGKLTTPTSQFSEEATGIAIQSNGKIVVAGYGTRFFNGNFTFDLTLVRYNTDGTPDNSFDGDGMLTTAIGTGNDFATAVAIQADQKIVVAGYRDSNVSPFRDFVLTRYNSNGSLDAGFDGDGIVTADIGNPGEDQGMALALSGNRIYVAGTSMAYSDGFNHFAVAAFQLDIAVLPVGLLSFTATIQTNSVGLQWKTSSEQNTSRFLIERSRDGMNFSSIGTVAAAGNSTDVKNYSYTDQQSLAGTCFYRLKMMDADERFTYSRIVAVIRNDAAKKLLLFPNPAKDELHIQTSGINEAAVLLISDVSGRILKQEKIQLAGSTSLTVDVRGFAKGNYYLVLKLKERDETRKFIKN